MSRIYSSIKNCRSCSSSELKNIISLGNIYLSEFPRTRKKPASSPLNMVICNKCHLVQLKETTNSALLYTDNYGYRSGINNTIQKDLADVVKNVLKHKKLSSNSIVIDIGANDGTLLSNYNKSITRIAIDPVKKFAKDSKKHANTVVTDFFSYDAYTKKVGKKKADVITAISCFYDLEVPNKFVEDVSTILTDNGLFVIQQNYLKSMIEQKAFDNIVHEHLEFYSLISLKNLLERHNLEIFDVELNQINGGSFRTYIARPGKRKITTRTKKLIEDELRMGLNKINTYKKFASDVKKTGNKTRKLISKLNEQGDSVYLYGASTRGNTLLQYFKLDSNLIKKAVERNPEKWGSYIGSVGIPIISEEQARKEKPEYMLILPWFFKDEFLKREKEYLKNGGHFIFPLPELQVI